MFFPVSFDDSAPRGWTQGRVGPTAPAGTVGRFQDFGVEAGGRITPGARWGGFLCGKGAEGAD